MILELFSPNVSCKVLCVPLLQCIRIDKIMWAFNKDGHYLVKSGYRLYCEKVATKDHLKVHGVGIEYGNRRFLPG